MKKLYILITFQFSIFNLLINAQVGVFTDTPQALFHIDGQQDNLITNDFISTQSGGHLKIALSKLPDTSTGAQLELGSNKSAFLPNRVALTSTIDNITVPSPVAGMIVYNTATTTGANRVIPGLYTHDGVKWNFLYNSGFSNMSLTYRDLQTSCTTIQGRANEPQNTIMMDFGGPINILEAGGYNFTFRMYGRTANTTTNVLMGVYYLWCMVYNPVTMDYDIPKDVVELDLPVYATGVPITATATLGANFNAGDKVAFRISNLPITSDVIWTLQGLPGLNANKTSLIYWRNYN